MLPLALNRNRTETPVIRLLVDPSKRVLKLPTPGRVRFFLKNGEFLQIFEKKMSNGQWSRARIDVSSCVKICGYNTPDILAHMALINKDSNVREDMQVFGTVIFETVNRFVVELSAAKNHLFPKGENDLCSNK